MHLKHVWLHNPKAICRKVLRLVSALALGEISKILSCFCCRFLALPRPGLAIYRNCIELETNLASVGGKDGLANARKLYESALTTYSQNVSLWQNYYGLETKVRFRFPMLQTR